MMNMMRSILSPDEQAHATCLARHLTAYMLEHYRHQPAFDPIRFPSIALCCTIENLDAPSLLLDDSVKLGAWIFDFDAALDQRRLSKRELALRLVQYERIVRGDPGVCVIDDPYGLALVQLTRTLRSKSIYGSLEYIWQHAYLRMIEGMLSEINNDSTPPALDTYLQHGVYSIGLPFYVISMWILRDEATILLYPKELLEMLFIASLCIRLANDLQSADRERLEGKTNSLFIEEDKLIASGIQPDTARELARAYIQNMLEQQMERFERLCDDRNPHKKSLRRLTQFVVHFYRRYDFHTAPALNDS